MGFYIWKDLRSPCLPATVLRPLVATEWATGFLSDLVAIERPTNFPHLPNNAADYYSELANFLSCRYRPPAAAACIAFVNSFPSCTIGANLSAIALAILLAMDNLCADHLDKVQEVNDRHADGANDDFVHFALMKWFFLINLSVNVTYESDKCQLIEIGGRTNDWFSQLYTCYVKYYPCKTIHRGRCGCTIIRAQNRKLIRRSNTCCRPPNINVHMALVRILIYPIPDLTIPSSESCAILSQPRRQ